MLNNKNKTMRNIMGKITEKLTNILKTPKESLVESVERLVQFTNTPPISVNITLVNGKIYINNNLNFFSHLTEENKQEILKSLLNDALNSIATVDTQENTPANEAE